MFGSIGMPELIIIFVIALIIFGPRKLPELGRSLGKSLAEFKKASNELRNTLEEEIRIEEQKETRRPNSRLPRRPSTGAHRRSASGTITAPEAWPSSHFRARRAAPTRRSRPTTTTIP